MALLQPKTPSARLTAIRQAKAAKLEAEDRAKRLEKVPEEKRASAPAAIAPIEAVRAASSFFSKVNELRNAHRIFKSKLPPRVRYNALKYHPGQTQVYREAKRFNVLDCGRRFGKTCFGGDLLAETASKGLPAGFFAPTYKYLIEAWIEIKERLSPMIYRANDAQHRIECHGGGIVEAWSLDSESSGQQKKYKAGRSRKFARVVIDEAAMVGALKRIFEAAISPSLIDLKGDAWFLSTPDGKNDFYQYYRQGQDHVKYPDWMSWKMPTTVNPHIPPEEIERASRELPELTFKQEYLAEFVDDGGAVFRNVTTLAVAAPEEPQQYHHYVMGIDLGRRLHFTVIAIFDVSVRPVRQVYVDRFNQMEWGYMVGRMAAAAKKYDLYDGLDCIIPDASGIGDPVTSQLRRALDDNGLNVAVNEMTITSINRLEKLLEPLALAFEQQDLQILDPAKCTGEYAWMEPIASVQISELESFSQARTPAGHQTYEAAGDDDTTFALALGWSRARYSHGGLDEPERVAIHKRIDRDMPVGVSPMAEMSRQYLANAILNNKIDPLDDFDIDTIGAQVSPFRGENMMEGW